MLIVASCIWDANYRSEPFSRCYSEEWVEKLYRGFKRNLTVPFRFVLFTDRMREFSEPIEQLKLITMKPSYGCFIEPFRLDKPMILVGLDTIIVDNIDHFARYCEEGENVALPRNPYQPDISINGVALIPPGNKRIFDWWRGENDMEWLRKFPWEPIDDLFAGQVLSLKAHDVRRKGLQGAKIIYCHGKPKPHELLQLDWVREHWS